LPQNSSCEWALLKMFSRSEVKNQGHMYFSDRPIGGGGAENAGPGNAGPIMSSLRDQNAVLENAGPENAGPIMSSLRDQNAVLENAGLENAGPKMQGW